MPHLIRTDYVENSNDTYWLANPNAPFGAFSPVIGKIGTIQDVRTRVANLLVAERMAGTDGLGAPKFTISNLLATAMKSQSLLAHLVLPTLVSSCESTPSATATDGTVVDLTAACAALASYDGTANLAATGGWLFGEWAAYAPNETTSGPSGFWTDTFDPAHPLTTPSHFNSTNPKMLVALANAVEALTAHHVALNVSYAQVQSVTRNSVVIPVSGCAAGCLNAMGAYDGNEAIYAGDYYGQAVYGNSMVTATELTRAGPVAEGILAYSEASNPASPRYSNMTTLYSKGHFVRLAYSPAQLAAECGNTTTTLTVP
jgi:acyl-homoserine-lactone acylase